MGSVWGLHILRRNDWVVPSKDKKCNYHFWIFLKKKNIYIYIYIYIESGGLIKEVNFTTNHWNHGWKNNIAIYSTNNEGKPVVDKRFIRILKNKIGKYMTSISKKLKEKKQ